MRGVGLDVRDYRLLQALLDDQFRAALRHQTSRLEDLAARITAITQALETRRVERVALVRVLAGPGAGSVASPEAIFSQATGRSREALESGWRMLQALVHDCKRLNTRNCQLLMDQHGIMQRVLHGEDETYAPA